MLKFFSRLLISAFAFGVAILIGEFVLRLLPSGSQAKYNSLFVYHDGYFTLNPNSSVTVDGIDYTINSDGLRDTVMPQPSEQNIERIAFLGDSITFGYGLALDTSYSKQLASQLRLRFPEREFEAINLGVSGLNTIGEIQRYIEKASKYSPQYVVLEMLLDDFIYPQHQQESVNIGVLGAIKEFAKVNLFATYFRLKGALNRAELVKQYPQATDLFGYINQIYRDEGAQLEATRAALLELQGLTQSRNQALLVVLFPYLIGQPANYPVKDLNDQWREFFTANGIVFVDLLELLPAADMANIRLEESDSVHPNSRGSFEIAKLLAALPFWDEKASSPPEPMPAQGRESHNPTEPR